MLGLGYVLGAAAVGWLAGESVRRGRRLGQYDVPEASRETLRTRVPQPLPGREFWPEGYPQAAFIDPMPYPYWRGSMSYFGGISHVPGVPGATPEYATIPSPPLRPFIPPLPSQKEMEPMLERSQRQEWLRQLPPWPAPAPVQPTRPAAPGPHGFQMQRLPGAAPETSPEEWRSYMRSFTPTQSQWGPASGTQLGPTQAAERVTGPQSRLPYGGGLPGAFGGALSLPGGGMAYQGPSLTGRALGWAGAVSPTGVQRSDEDMMPFELGRPIALG